MTKASGLGPRKVLRVLLSTPTSREIKVSKAMYERCHLEKGGQASEDLFCGYSGCADPSED